MDRGERLRCQCYHTAGASIKRYSGYLSNGIGMIGTELGDGKRRSDQ